MERGAEESPNAHRGFRLQAPLVNLLLKFFYFVIKFMERLDDFIFSFSAEMSGTLLGELCGILIGVCC